MSHTECFDCKTIRIHGMAIAQEEEHFEWSAKLEKHGISTAHLPFFSVSELRTEKEKLSEVFSCLFLMIFLIRLNRTTAPSVTAPRTQTTEETTLLPLI